jgi:hypothetical protein
MFSDESTFKLINPRAQRVCRPASVNCYKQRYVVVNVNGQLPAAQTPLEPDAETAITLPMLATAVTDNPLPPSLHCSKTFQQKIMLGWNTQNRASFKSLYRAQIPYFALVTNLCCN